MRVEKIYFQVNSCLTKLYSYSKQASLLACLVFLFISTKAQNLIPNHSFENVIINENNIDNIPGYTTDWLNMNTPDWFHAGNIGSQTVWSCLDSNCAGVPKNGFGFQYPKSGLGYAGFLAYDKYNGNATREYLKVQLVDSLSVGEQYCVSFNLVLANISRYAMSKVGAYFTKNEYVPPPIPAGYYWHFHVVPQALNNGPFIIDTLNWTKIELSFVADSAYQWITIGGYTDSLTTDSIRVSNAPGGGQGAYNYIDDIFLTRLDEPASAALTDTIVATENTAIQLGNNTNTNASYLWWPADNINDVNNPNPNLLVTQSGWHYVQKTQCSYVTYDSVYVKANAVGVNEYEKRQKQFKLFPNPNNGNFSIENIDGEEIDGSIIITDVLGKIIFTKDWTKTSSIDINLNTGLSKGLYFIQIKNENKESIYTTKFMFN